MLRPGEWKPLRQSRGRTSYVSQPCYFRESEAQVEKDLWADARGIHGATRTYDCPRETGKLLERHAF